MENDRRSLETKHFFGHDLIPEREVCRVFGKTVNALRIQRHSRRGPPYHKIGRAIFYAPADIADWITATRRTPQDRK